MTELHVTRSLHSAQGPIRLDVSFTIAEGEFLALYGPSGAGKTTVLRMLAGLEQPESGYIRSNGQTWFDHRQHLWVGPRHRAVGVVFQDYALFPNMTIREQLRFALPDQRNRALVDTLLEMMSLTELANRRPTVLSGGQQQRVALARAVARQPRLLLLDEPLSALDTETRLRLQEEISQVHKQFKLTTVLVSHDNAEIIRLADRVISLQAGKIDRQGAPAALFGSSGAARPSGRLGTVIAIQRQGAQLQLTVSTEGALTEVLVPESPVQVGDRIVVVVEENSPSYQPLKRNGG
ncbi:sulfate/molybdate ABC transporter ATP-binding protein [Nibrella saemangeumensis]|uniref:Sulfate/molybdate ABC transporter ATP-binding protein n=1 Tax=Nibrella saemangeumensis TaxID=1084526 RepID=A0ABP8MLE6_9BACT